MSSRGNGGRLPALRAARRLARFLLPRWKLALCAPAALLVEVSMDLLQPRLVQRIIDDGVARHDVAAIAHTGGAMASCAAVGLLAGLGCSVAAMLTAQGAGADLRGALFRKIQSFAFSDLDRFGTAPLVTRLTSDVSQVQEVIAIALRGMVRMPLLLLGSIVMASLTCPGLSWIMLVLVPLVALVLGVVLGRMHPAFRAVQGRLDALNVILQENLAGVRVVKAFARSAHEIARFREANLAFMRRNLGAVRLGGVTMPLMMAMLNAATIAAVWFGGGRVRQGTLQVGQVVAFANYLFQSLQALRLISMMIVQVSRSGASAQRVAELLEVDPAVGEAVRKTGFPAPSLSGDAARIVFEDVSFGYGAPGASPGTRLALERVSLAVEPGETVAFVGATGAGKSTLVHLVPRFYDVWRGRVTLDGTDVRALPKEALRRQVGVVFQESVLFSGTIRENIAYGCPEAGDAEVAAAARAAQADAFIRALPHGYDTRADQRGVNLSGGQKQRIALARALLLRPRVLILDDSTSAVDLRTEARIQRAIREQEFPQTRLVVAQRLSTVVHADKVAVLDEGRLVAVGPHRELLATCAVYREILESQTRHGALAHVED